MSQMSQFPNRPETDDFWLMSQIINQLLEFQHSSKVKSKIPVEFTKSELTEKAVAYMAQQRALSIQRGTGIANDPSTHAAIAVAWVEAFLTGVKYGEKKGGE